MKKKPVMIMVKNDSYFSVKVKPEDYLNLIGMKAGDIVTFGSGEKFKVTYLSTGVINFDWKENIPNPGWQQESPLFLGDVDFPWAKSVTEQIEILNPKEIIDWLNKRDKE